MNDSPPPQTRVIGRYSILRELRRERHSVSYAAVDPVMNRQLVLKAVELLPAGQPITTEDRKRVEQAFVRQAQAAGRLQHPNIVTVYDAGLSAAFGFLVIERPNGRPLHELLAGGLRPEYVQCASIAARIADALDCAHANGIAHGQLGPQHVTLQADGAPKISGFGGWIDDGAAGDDALAGTARLLPYFQNEVNEEARLRDVRAVGQLLYMMLTGRAPPAPAPQAPAAEGEASSIVRAVRPETPGALARIVDQALRLPQGEGARSAGALRDALTAFIWNERAENVPPASLGIPLAAPPSRAPVHVATIAPGDGAGVRPATQPAALAPAASAAEAAPVSAPPAAADGPPRRIAGIDVHALIERIRPWAIRYRIAIFAVGAFFFVAIFLGVLLGNLRHPSAVAQSAPSADSAIADSPTPAGAGTANPKTPVSFDVRPWGEVFIDAKPTGVSPPLSQVELPAGRHHIEIRRDPSPAWSTDIDVQGTNPIRIEHGFE